MRAVNYLAKSLAVEPALISRLAVVFSVESPRGYAIKCAGTAICAADFADGKKYYALSDTHPASYQEIAEADALSRIELAKSQSINTGAFKHMQKPEGNGWISADFIQANDWELFNAFSNCEFVFGVDGHGFQLNKCSGRPENLPYRAGDVVNLLLHLQRPSPDQIAFVRFNG